MHAGWQVCVSLLSRLSSEAGETFEGAVGGMHAFKIESSQLQSGRGTLLYLCMHFSFLSPPTEAVTHALPQEHQLYE